MTRFHFLLLLLSLGLALPGCPSDGDDDDSGASDDDDATGDDDDATGDDDDATGDDDDATGDDDDATGDDDDATGDDDDATDEEGLQDFLTNGPAPDKYWESADMGRDFQVNECNYGDPYTWNWVGDGFTVANVDVGASSFELTLDGSSVGSGSTVCTWDAQGAWSCNPWAMQQTLSGPDATIDWDLVASGQFGSLTGEFANAPENTYDFRYSTTITASLEMDCTGNDCGVAAAGSGVQGWPCTTTIFQWAANLDDPNLPPLSCW